MDTLDVGRRYEYAGTTYVPVEVQVSKEMAEPESEEDAEAYESQLEIHALEIETRMSIFVVQRDLLDITPTMESTDVDNIVQVAIKENTSTLSSDDLKKMVMDEEDELEKLAAAIRESIQQSTRIEVEEIEVIVDGSSYGDIVGKDDGMVVDDSKEAEEWMTKVGRTNTYSLKAA